MRTTLLEIKLRLQAANEIQNALGHVAFQIKLHLYETFHNNRIRICARCSLSNRISMNKQDALIQHFPRPTTDPRHNLESWPPRSLYGSALL